MRPAQILGPLALIALGVIFLIDNLFVEIRFGRIIGNFWPLVLIVVGIGQVLSGVSRGPARGWGHLAGGAVTITMGLIFQVQELGGPRFGSTWPFLLIVVGGLGLLRALTFRGGFEQ